MELRTGSWWGSKCCLNQSEESVSLTHPWSQPHLFAAGGCTSLATHIKIRLGKETRRGDQERSVGEKSRRGDQGRRVRDDVRRDEVRREN